MSDEQFEMDCVLVDEILADGLITVPLDAPRIQSFYNARMFHHIEHSPHDKAFDWVRAMMGNDFGGPPIEAGTFEVGPQAGPCGEILSYKTSVVDTLSAASTDIYMGDSCGFNSQGVNVKPIRPAPPGRTRQPPGRTRQAPGSHPAGTRQDPADTRQDPADTRQLLLLKKIY